MCAFQMVFKKVAGTTGLLVRTRRTREWVRHVVDLNISLFVFMMAIYGSMIRELIIIIGDS